MKVFLASFLVVISVLIIGCDNSVEPTPPKTSGETTIKTAVINFVAKGFLFSQGNLIEYPNSQNIKPDFLLSIYGTNEEPFAGVFLLPPSNHPSFLLLAQINDSDEASKYFSELSEVPDTTYNLYALPLEKNQIWAINTQNNKYAKIFIINTKAYVDSSIQNSPTPYGEATFKWMYQPNGSRRF